jgi:hypothetical protein
MMLKNFFGQTLEDPRMLKGLEGRDPFQRVPLEALVEEIQKDMIGAFEDVLDLLGAGLSYLAS